MTDVGFAVPAGATHVRRPAGSGHFQWLTASCPGDDCDVDGGDADGGVGSAGTDTDGTVAVLSLGARF